VHPAHVPTDVALLIQKGLAPTGRVMLKFLVYENGKPATHFAMRNVHLVGADDIGVRSQIRFEDGVIIADKSSVGPAALALQLSLEEVGDLILQTCLLPERLEPYVLHVELARHRLMKTIAKQEDWAMFDLPEDHPASKRLAMAKKKFIDALSAEDPVEADRLGRQSLVMAIDASEELALAHADGMLHRRRQNGSLSRNVFGCGVTLSQNTERVAPALLANFDYVRLPTPWRSLEPEEQEYNWTQLDGWCEWAFRNRLPIVAGPIVSFHPSVVPDWLYIWEHDYDTVRDLLYEHIERVVTRYRSVVTLWNVISGVHVNNHFTFSFEQLMDLTRMAIMLVKKVHPTGRTLIEISHPFGEYYANNQRSIPPIMYAEMVLQAGIPFDGFGVKLLMGQASEGQATRDLMSVSALLDRFNGLGKPVHVTAVAVPSETQAAGAAEPRSNGDGGPGFWRKPWSQVVQGHWLEAFYHVCLSKPFVESVAWLNLTDDEGLELPTGGLVNSEFKPKTAFRRLTSFRKMLQEA
jgi:hypothetical protein